MTETRKQQIIRNLLALADEFEPSELEPELTMTRLICMYNDKYSNPELIGGDWVIENVPELADLPT